MCVVFVCVVFFFQAEDGIRDLVRSRGLGDVYKRQATPCAQADFMREGVSCASESRSENWMRSLLTVATASATSDKMDFAAGEGRPQRREQKFTWLFYTSYPASEGKRGDIRGGSIVTKKTNKTE